MGSACYVNFALCRYILPTLIIRRGGNDCNGALMMVMMTVTDNAMGLLGAVFNHSACANMSFLSDRSDQWLLINVLRVLLIELVRMILVLIQ